MKMLPLGRHDLSVVTHNRTQVNFLPMTLTNLVTLAPSTSSLEHGLLKGGPSMSYYTERIVEDILTEMFMERRGHYPETSSSCHFEQVQAAQPVAELHVDKRLKYWHEILQKRKKLHERVQRETGKKAEEVLFNRRSTLDNRDRETIVRIMDYAERLDPQKLATKPISKLKDATDPCACECPDEVAETLPKAERLGVRDVEVIGLPKVIQKELLGAVAANNKLEHGWLDSSVLDKRLEKGFKGIRNVVEFFPDLDNLQVTGTNLSSRIPEGRAQLLSIEDLHTISASNSGQCDEEQVIESWSDHPTMELEVESELPEIGLKINNKDYIVCDAPFTECVDLKVKFSCDPYQRRIRRVLQLTNIGKQTLSFNWTQGVYFYNRATLLLAQDKEFLFDTESFRLTYGDTYTLTVMYQPRKVNMSVELWRLNVEPRIFCTGQSSLLLRFHGRCTPPKEYMTRLRELHSTAICKSNTNIMAQLTAHLASVVPLIQRPEACCPYERDLDEREIFNSLNPGYNCVRFDDLEVLKGMYKHLKKPREPQWDLRLDSIRRLIMRIDGFDEREIMFANLMIVVEPLIGMPPSVESENQVSEQKQRTRFVYVRGAICNGIEEWEDLMNTIEESLYKQELQRFYKLQLSGNDDEEDDDEESVPQPAKIEFVTLEIAEDELESEEKIKALILKKLYHSKYFRDALYIQTYSHLCNIAEDIVSIIESTEIVPT